MIDVRIPDNEYLTVRELAALLRVKERKVYDLAASGAVPCSRATGKLLFPAAEIRKWIEDATHRDVPEQKDVELVRPAIVLGSHDPLLDWAIRQSRCGLANYFDGSLDGLARFARGEGVATGLHLYDSQSDSWNVPAVSRAASGSNAVLISFAMRRRGLVFRGGGRGPKKLRDVATLRFVPRQPESGADLLLKEIARAEELDLSKMNLADVARTEDEAVETVRRGDADVTFGLETVARNYGLDFLPMKDEEFALLVDRKSWFEPHFQRLLEFFASPQFKERAKSYAGYDVSDIGRVVWNA